MKSNLLLLLITLLSASLAAQTTVQWTDSIPVTSTSLAITAPRVQLLTDGTPLITWGTSGNPARIWSARFENNAFSAPVSVLQSSPSPSLYGFGGYDVAVSDSQIFVVYENLQQGILIARSNDGGMTFSPATTVQGGVTGGYVTLSSVTIDGTGNPVVSYILDKNGAVYHVRRSTDAGQTFGDAVIGNAPAPGGQVCECCTSDLLASGDSIWMVYRNNNLNIRDIWVSRSTDLAATFDTATDVDSTNWFLNFCPIAGPTIARSGDSLVTVWMSGASGIGRVYLSTLHAGTMQPGVQLAFPPLLPQSPQSQADVTASGDTIGMVFLEKSKEILFHYSTNGTADLQTQSTRFTVANHTLKYPSIDFQNGVFHLVYVDDTSDKVLYRRGTITQSSPATELTKLSGISLFPNPTNGITTIQTGGEPILSIAVTDVQGRTVQQWNRDASSANEPVNIDLKNSSPGLYFVQVETQSGWNWGKVVLNSK